MRGHGRAKLKHGDRFVGLPHYLLRSVAWLALSPNGKAVLLHIWVRHNGANNGQIVYAVREAAEIGLSRTVAARALDELVELGFLRITRQSAFSLKTKEAREWRLTAEPTDGHAATKDFMRWSGLKKRPASHQPKPKTQSPQGHKQSPRGTVRLSTQQYYLLQSPEGHRWPANRPSHSPPRGTLLLYQGRVSRTRARRLSG
jgi:hypothetical protein